MLPDGRTAKLEEGLSIVRDIDEPAFQPQSDSKFMLNLDSPIFGFPIGLGVLFRTKLGLPIGGIYMERAFIQNWSVSFASGQNVVAENVNLIMDRIVPFEPSTSEEDGQRANGWDDINEENRKKLVTYANDNRNSV